MRFHFGTFFGIPLFFHWSWFLLVALIGGLNGYFGLAIMLAAFACVILHEYGHCLMAKYLGLYVQDVTVYPIGGLARINFINTALSEFLVAIAGPAVNLLLATVFIVTCLFMDPPHDALPSEYPVFTCLLVGFWINIVMLLFNMLPIFPMDGGRVLRACLAKATDDYMKATWLAVRIAQGLSLALIFGALWVGNFWIAMIFFFIFLSSQNELVATKHYTSVHTIKWKVSVVLGKPELATAPLSEVIAALEDVEDEKVMEVLKIETLLPLLKDLAGDAAKSS